AFASVRTGSIGACWRCRVRGSSRCVKVDSSRRPVGVRCASRSAREGSHMVARIATYSFTGDGEELGKRAEAGILPILEAQPGFKSYAVAFDESKIFSSSAWESRPEAETGSAAVAAWVAENM